MSVPKNRRRKSSADFEMIYFRLVDGVDELIAHDFFAEGGLAERNRTFLNIRCESLQRFTDDLLYYIQIANSIYPQCEAELNERRLAQDKAVGVCFAILTTLQRILQRLRVPGCKYVMDVKNIEQMINSLKAWRKSDNRLRTKIAAEGTNGPKGPAVQQAATGLAL